jgi:hypothetical protein
MEINWKVTVFWDVVPHSLIGACCLHHQHHVLKHLNFCSTHRVRGHVLCLYKQWIEL